MHNKQIDSLTSYDGYYKYGHEVSQTYDCSREIERHWQLEDSFIEKYLRSRQVDCLLDLPVGTGRFFHHYTRIRNVTGVDISEEMLLKAKEKKTLFPNCSIHLELGDVFNLHFSNSTFDTVIVFRLFHLMPETSLDPAIKELCRVSRKDVVVQTYVPLKINRNCLQVLLGAGYRRFISLFKNRSLSEQFNITPMKPWSHIQAYYHEQGTVDAKFASYGFIPSVSTLLDEYEGAEVKATVYSKAI